MGGEYQETYSQMVKRVRKEKGISMHELAKSAHVSVLLIPHIEKNGFIPSRTQMIKISRALGRMWELTGIPNCPTCGNKLKS